MTKAELVEKMAKDADISKAAAGKSGYSSVCGRLFRRFADTYARSLRRLFPYHCGQWFRDIADSCSSIRGRRVLTEVRENFVLS